MASPLRNFIYRQAEPAAARLTPGILPPAIPPSVQDPGPPPDPTAHEYVERPTTGGEKALAAILPILGALQGIQPRNPNTGRRGFDVGAAAQGIAGGLVSGLGNIHERKMQEHKAWWDQQQADQEAAFKTAALGLQAEHNTAMENRPGPKEKPQVKAPVMVGTHLYDRYTGEDLGLAPDLMAGKHPPKQPAVKPAADPSKDLMKEYQTNDRELRKIRLMAPSSAPGEVGKVAMKARADEIARLEARQEALTNMLNGLMGSPSGIQQAAPASPISGGAGRAMADDVANSAFGQGL